MYGEFHYVVWDDDYITYHLATTILIHFNLENETYIFCISLVVVP